MKVSRLNGLKIKGLDLSHHPIIATHYAGKLSRHAVRLVAAEGIPDVKMDKFQNKKLVSNLLNYCVLRLLDCFYNLKTVGYWFG
jgi:hypothetical protein